ncbi:MAG: hypothetical protein ACRD2D_01890, partial [Terriglobales bacterium]
PQRQTQESFTRLFGSGDFKKRLKDLSPAEREGAAVEQYADTLRTIGGFPYTCTAIVLHPEIDSTRYHLILATRSRKGVEVFKRAEGKAMEVQERARAEAQGRRREAATGQLALLPPQELHDAAYYNSLRQANLEASQRFVREKLGARKRISYDELWDLALSRPLTWEADLKNWIVEWQKQGLIGIEGMLPRQRVPHTGRNLFIIWKT